MIDKTPLYAFDEKGIQTRGSQKIILWKELYYFKSEIIYRKYVNIRQITLSDQNGKKVITIDLTHSDMKVETIEHILKKKKLRQKGKVIGA